MRLARESIAQEAANSTDYELTLEGDDDKTYAARNIAKTIGTVCYPCHRSLLWTDRLS